MKITEIELQAKVEHVEPLKALLKKEGEFVYEHHQLDQYYAPAHRDFLAADPIEEWLRLRDADGNLSINYKKWHFDENQKGLYADEYETSVGSLEIAEKILAAVDMRKTVAVDKVRRMWRYRDYEVCLDSVQGLGDFVELEYAGDRSPEDHQEIVSGMIAFLKDLGCGAITLNHSGYPAMLLGRKEKTEVL